METRSQSEQKQAAQNPKKFRYLRVLFCRSSITDWFSVFLATLLVFISFKQIHYLQIANENTQQANAVSKTAADAAEISALAAKDSADSAKKSLVVSQRSWLTPSTPAWSIAPSSDGQAQLSISIQNIGATPATRVTQKFTVIARRQDPKAGDDVRNSKFWGEIEEISKSLCTIDKDDMVIFPGQKTTFYTDPINADQSEFLNSKPSFAIGFGCILYKTLGEAKRTSYCFYSPRNFWGQSNEFRPCPVGNYAN